MATNYQVDPVFYSRSYLPADCATYTADSNHGQRLSMFFPPGDPSDHGWGKDATEWPIIYCQFFNAALSSSNSALVDSSTDTLQAIVGESGRMWAAVDQGIPAVAIQVTAAETAASACPATGNGLWHAPGGVDRRWEGGTAFAQKTYPNNYTDAIRAMQWLRWNWHRLPKNAQGYLRRFNPEGIVVGGRSGGGHLAATLGFAPSRAGSLGVGGQYDMNTIPNAGVATAAMMPWFKMWKQDTDVPHANMFPKAETGADADVYAGFDARLIPGAASAPTLYDYQNAASLPFTVGGIGPEYIPPWAFFSSAAATGLAFHMPIREDYMLDGTEHNSVYGHILKNLFGSKFHVYLDAAGTANALTYGQDVDGIAEIDDGVADGNSDNTFTRFLKTYGRTPRWDSVMPGNGIFQQTRVETIGRMIVAPNPTRKSCLVRCTDVSSDLFIGPHQGGAQQRIRAGEEYEYKGNGYIWGRSSSGTCLLSTREMG